MEPSDSVEAGTNSGYLQRFQSIQRLGKNLAWSLRREQTSLSEWED